MSAANAPGKESGIEKSLLYLSLGVVAVFLVFIGSFLWVQTLLSRSQAQNSELTAPTQTVVASLKDAINALLIHRARVASAQSAAELAKLQDRASAEVAIKAAQSTLAGLFPRLSEVVTGRENDLRFARVTDETQRFLDADAAYLNANVARWTNQERLEAKISGIEIDLKDFLQSAEGISGKIRFAYGSSVRRIARMVAKSGFDAEARGLIATNLLGGSNLKNGIVSEILGGAGELNRLAGKIGLVKTQDQLNSLLNNELLQLRELLSVNLEDLAEEVRDDRDCAVIVAGLQKSLVDLSRRIMDVDNPDSLISLKKTVFDDARRAASAQDDLGKTSAELGTTMAVLVRMSEDAGKTFDMALRRAGGNTQILLLVITCLALAAGAVGGRAVRTNLRLLRAQNTNLIRLKEELTTINARLEHLVDERTRAIRTILDHVSFGLMICNGTMQVNEGFSRSCLGVLGVTGDLTRRPLTELLGLDARSADHFKSLYDQIFDRDFALGDLAIDQLPTRFPAGERTLGLVGSVVHDAAGNSTGVLFCISDISTLVHAEAEVARNRSLIQMLSNRDSFRQLVLDARAGFARIYGELAGGNAGEKVVRQELHTLKGNFGVFGLAAIADAIHHLEDEPVITRVLVEAVEGSLKSFLHTNRDLLGVSYGVAAHESFVVPAALVDSVEALVSNGRADVRETFQEFCRLIRLKRARTLIGPIEAAFEQLAQRLDKNATLTFVGEDVLFPQSGAAVLKSLTHLVRNSLDHGVEARADRGDKPEVATVRLAIVEAGDTLEIVVEDDGRGLSRRAIGAKAIANGLISAARLATMSDSDVYGLIFAEGLSTASEVTSVSGRGVGMGAVQAAIAEAGATIEITSVTGKGTRFTIRVPNAAAASRTRLLAA